MNDKKLAYIEESGLLFEQFGMTRMAGRIFGYLVVSDKEQVSFDEIKEALQASKGSISGVTKQLIAVGFIQPITLPGDRKTYFKLTEANPGKIIKARFSLFAKFSELTQKGKGLKSKDDDVSAWLEETSMFYTWIIDEVDKVIEKWEKEKRKIMGAQKQNGIDT